MEQSLDTSLDLIAGKLVTWYESLMTHLPNFIVALLIMGAFIFAARLAKNVTCRVLKKTTDNKAVNGLLQTIIFLGVIVAGLFTALGVLNLDKTVTSLLAGAGVIGLALGFAFQEIAANFISGIFIAFRKPYSIGDIIQINDIQGSVERIDLRTTSIRTFDGLEAILPNKDMFTKAIYNFTSTPDRRVDLDVGVSYGDNLEEVQNIATKAIRNMKHRIQSKDVEFFYTEFGSSSINFQIRFWVEYPGNKEFLKARHEAIMAIKSAFDKHNITIPFPIRTMDFGIKGGMNLTKPLETLKEVVN